MGLGGKPTPVQLSKQRSGGDRGGNLGERKVAAVHVDIWSGMKFPHRWPPLNCDKKERFEEPILW